MMFFSFPRAEDVTLALAGVFQAAALAHSIATRNEADERFLNASLQSLFAIDAADVPTVYGGQENVALGLQTLYDILTRKKNTPDSAVVRYVIGLLHLEHKLNKNAEMQKNIRRRLQQAQIQIQHFPVTHENVLANLGGIYLDTISTFPVRIKITGQPNYLQNPINVNKIRALLLAGIRSAVLWQQVGGRKWHLMIHGKKMAETAKRLMV